MYHFRPSTQNNQPYLKLINRRDQLSFKVEESYTVSENSTIGRSRKNEIVLNDPFISGVHAKIWKSGGVYFLEDLGSKNGSFLNGERITEPFTLRNGDRISLGQVEFLFVLSENINSKG